MFIPSTNTAALRFLSKRSTCSLTGEYSPNSAATSSGPSTARRTMIKVSGVTKSFNGQTVLKDLNLHVPDGQILAILGESGSGKSVLLQHLIGLKKQDRGAVEINGV